MAIADCFRHQKANGRLPDWQAIREPERSRQRGERQFLLDISDMRLIS